jgi:hypothetical protein
MIKRKSDVKEFLFSFCLHAEWDGEKFYAVISDEANDGTITIMQYTEGNFTIYRKNVRFCDRREIALGGEELSSLIWKKRKYINRLMKIGVQ